MRNILLSCVSIFFISLIFLGFRKKSPPSKFYYTFDVKKELTPHPTKMILRFLSIKYKDSMNTSIINNNEIRKIQWYKNNTVIVDMQSSSDQLMWLNRFTSDTNLISANPVYLIDKGQEVSFTTEFVVQFKPEISSQAIDSINRRYKVSILKKEDFYYLLSVEPKADVLD